MSELKSCPFCGSTDTSLEPDGFRYCDDRRYVQLIAECNGCTASMKAEISWSKYKDLSEIEINEKLKAEITAMWNARTPQQPQPAAVPSELVNRIHERFQEADGALDHIFKMRVVGEVHQYAAKARYQLGQIYRAAIVQAESYDHIGWRYKFTDPISGRAVWRNSTNKWNGQSGTEAQEVYVKAAQPDKGKAT